MSVRQRVLALATCLALILGVSVALTGTTAQAATGPIYPVMNTSESPPDGVYFRNSPAWSDTSRTYGLGVFQNEQVRLECYAFGEAVGPATNRLWYYALDVTRPSVGEASNEGMINAHYVDDKAVANVVDAGVPACVNNRPPADPVAPPPPLETPTAAPTTTPPTQPPGGSSPSNEVSVVNADGGVYWRSGPDWSLAIQSSGQGVYNGDRVALECYVRGGTVPPNNNNPLWYLASVSSGRGQGKGYVNDHFLNTGTNQPDLVVSGVPACAIGGSGGAGGGTTVVGNPAYKFPTPKPIGTTPSNGGNGATDTGPNPKSINGVELGAARDGWHQWGACQVRDYDGPNKQWVIAVQTAHGLLVVHNGMLFGWFDQNGGPGALGCPIANEQIQGADPASKVTWITQPFQGGTLYWSSGMDHAVHLSDTTIKAIRWAWGCLPDRACNYSTTVGDSPTTIPNYFNFCLGFVYNAYTVGAGATPVGGPTGDAAKAYQWWDNDPSRRGDTQPPPGTFAIWGQSSPTSAGHIVLSVGGGWAISTWDGSTATIHLVYIKDLTPGTYDGWVWPGV